jgi:recombination associated protein RdgC
MWFKNLAVLRFTEPFTLDAADLWARLAQRPFRHCGSLEASSSGWAAPLGKDALPLVHGTDCLMLCLQTEEKILPAAAVNEVVSRRVEEIEEAQGRPVLRKERDGIREEVLQDLLPRAFTHTHRTYGYIDPKGGWLIVDTASAKKAEEFSSKLRQVVGSLPVVPLAVKNRPSFVLTQWLGEEGPPPRVTLESECELRSPEEDGGIIRCRKHDLGAPEIQNHLEAGKEVVKLALTWKDRISLILDEDLAVKRLRFLDVVQEEAADVDTNDPAERFDVNFSIMSLELSAFLPALVGMFGGINEAK